MSDRSRLNKNANPSYQRDNDIFNTKVHVFKNSAYYKQAGQDIFENRIESKLRVNIFINKCRVPHLSFMEKRTKNMSLLHLGVKYLVILFRDLKEQRNRS